MTEKTLQVDNEKLKNALRNYTEKATLNWDTIVANTARTQQKQPDDQKDASLDGLLWMRQLIEDRCETMDFDESDLENTYEEIRQGLLAKRKDEIPKGWRLVPEKHTQAMLSAVMEHVEHAGHTGVSILTVGWYDDLLAASPEHEAQPKATDKVGDGTGLYDRRGIELRVGNVVHWTDGGDDLCLEERIETRWDRIAVVSKEGILPKFTVIDSPSAETKRYANKFCYGHFIYKDTEKYLTIVADSTEEYHRKFRNAGECMKWVLYATHKDEAAK